MKTDQTPVVERAGQVRPDPTPAKIPPRDYRVVCISIYETDLAELDAKVAELKGRGIARANRSWLIRLALSRLDLDTVTEADRP